MTVRRALGIVVFIAASFAEASVVAAAHYDVTITNITKAQTFTPILVFSHKPGVKLFSLGQPASVELEQLAEQGYLVDLMALLEANPDVGEVVATESSLASGQSVTVSVTADSFSQVSLAAMLIPTNDAFVSVVGATSTMGKAITLYAPAYDAGTEPNDELCASIPGPPDICQGEGFNPSRVGAEGFIHVHGAIHGIGDLAASTWDWRNPVAEVAISRVN
jgi:hypothetical protein